MKSFFIITFPDGTTVHSDDVSWITYSEKIKVTRQGMVKLVYASIVPIKSIHVNHNGRVKILEIPEGCRVFQAISARNTFAGERTTNEITGRVVGLIKDNTVIEEYNISGELNMIMGFKL